MGRRSRLAATQRHSRGLVTFPAGREPRQQLEAGRVRLSKVEQQASPPRGELGVVKRARRFRKFLAGSMGFHREAEGLEQVLHGIADGRIVIDDKYCRPGEISRTVFHSRINSIREKFV